MSDPLTLADFGREDLILLICRMASGEDGRHRLERAMEDLMRVKGGVCKHD